MKNDSADFIATVKDLFSFLEEFGFVLSNIEENRLYAKVEFVAGKLAIFFSYDIKEQTMDCYIGKVANGVIVADRRRGGYWSSLFDYLVKECDYRGGSMPSRQGAYALLHEYKSWLKTYCVNLLENKDIG